jgi:hypothetical protein
MEALRIGIPFFVEDLAVSDQHHPAGGLLIFVTGTRSTTEESNRGRPSPNR